MMVTPSVVAALFGEPSPPPPPRPANQHVVRRGTLPDARKR